VTVTGDDDRDEAGAGRPAPPEVGPLERRDETRTETGILVRSVVILLLIAAALTARALFVH